MSEHFFDIANIHGQEISFELIPFTECKQLQNIQGVAVVVKKDFYGWHSLFKIQSHSLGHALRTEKVHQRIVSDNPDQSFYSAYLPCKTPIERYAVY
jgi:hypothetical protein